MADVQVQYGKAMSEIAAMESRAEEDLPSKDDSDASYVFVSGDHDPSPDPYSNGIVALQPDANGVHHHHSTTGGVQDGTLEEVAALQSPPQDHLDSPDDDDDEGKAEVEPLPSQISAVKDAQPDPNLEEGEHQLPPLQDAVSAEDPQTEPGLESPDVLPPLFEKDVKLDAADDTQSPASQKLDASALVSDLHAGLGNHLADSNGGTSDHSLSLKVESSSSSDSKTVQGCPIARENETPELSACETSFVADGNMLEAVSVEIDSVLESVQLPVISQEALPDLPQATPSEIQLPVVVETLPSAANYEDADVPSQENGSPVRALEHGFLDEDPVLAEEVEETTIGSVQESVQLPDISQEAHPDLPQATPSESQLSVVVETFPSAANHEDADVPSQENGSHVRVLEHGFLDKDPVLAEEVEETTIGTDAGDSSSKDPLLPEDKEVQKEPVHADAVECCPTSGMTFGTIPVTFSTEVVSIGDVGEFDGMFNEDNPDGHASADDSTDGHSGETNSSKEVEGDYTVPVSLTASTEDMQRQDVHVSESEVLDKSMNSSENTVADPGWDQNAKVDSLSKNCEENGTNGLHVEKTSTSSLEGSSSDANDGQNASSDVVRRPFYYMVKVPYFEDQSLRDQIKDAELRVAEKTEIRDAIQAQRQIPREKQRENANIIKASKAARGSLSAKRREIDSVNLVIDKAKVASQVDDIDAQIRNMEHSMQHETLSLKEEKRRIRDIKQLKLEREQLSNKMASQVEVQQALDQKDQAEECLKLLKKEADLLRENFIKADADAKVAQQKFDEEQKKLDELDDRYRSANAIRQEAYAHLQSLKKRFYDKRRFFSQFKGESERAKTLALNKGWQGLEHHCDNQLNRVMELWNNNDEFRKDYMRCNLRSTIWRLGTLDGRSLGPGEEPPLIPTFNERVAKLNTVTSDPTVVEVERSVPCAVTKTGVAKSLEKVGDKKNMTAKAKDAVRSMVVDTNTVSGGDKIIEKASEEDHKLTKEEEEMAKMAEELRKKEEEARLKEQRKLEEKVKAIEAMERKKRNAERAQARAAVKAQKQAELKEKEREKKARKKEKKKAAAAEVVGDSSSSSCTTEAASSEAKECEARENPVAVSKRPQKGKQFTKQSKAKSSIPPPLRNRGRRRVQTWMWVVIALVALFVVGYVISFFSLGRLIF